jgi:hypothetical protein
MSADRPLVDVAQVLDGLKDFQRATAEHAFDRLFDPTSSGRFLVADEVGLGKTMVARGVTAKAIDRLQAEGVERVDVVYICSNTDIARQNVSKLAVTREETPSIASRLTLLPAQLRQYSNRRLNIIALTPATSFDHGSAMGVAEERALLYVILSELWDFGTGTGPKNLLQGGVRDQAWWRQRLRDLTAERDIDEQIVQRFAESVAARDGASPGAPSLRTRFDEIADAYKGKRKLQRVPAETRGKRASLIAELRGLLAAACVEMLEPDLVILDEFQRFKHLLSDDESDAAHLARDLFSWQHVDRDERARVLLLSATPYRPYTVRADGQGDDHYEDFLATAAFLFDDPARTRHLRGVLAEYRGALYHAGSAGLEKLHALQHDIEDSLSQVISRTERLTVSGAHNGMTKSRTRTAPVHESDLRSYLLVHDLAGQLGHPQVTELWKSAPYLLNFLDGYELRKRLETESATAATSRPLADILRAGEAEMLSGEAVESFAELDAGTPRLRELAADVIGSGAWRLLWVPPAMPYYRLAGAYGEPQLEHFTKRLVFSAWRAAPRAAAGLLSYLAERELTLRADPAARNTPEARGQRGNDLRFARDSRDRLSGMPVLALMYPSAALARLADPRELARAQRGATQREAIAWAEERMRTALGALPPGAEDGPVDERWYWAAPIMLEDADARAWLNTHDLASQWSGRAGRGEDSNLWAQHVELAGRAADGALSLGRRPADLPLILAELALGGPGVLALRSLARVTNASYDDTTVRDRAAQVAWGLRSLFNTPEATLILRTEYRGYPRWRAVVRHSIDGGLQAVLDEHAHVLREAEGVTDAPAAEATGRIADAMLEALGLRSSRVSWSEIAAEGDSVAINTQRLYTSFAARFGEQETASVTGETPARPAQLRAAFNSPYWPFVLVSTSVGQEGLDFHPYCHVVVHWNLPTNPVDLEQREGRVHRYKGHAVRKNVSARHASAAIATEARDPWSAGFELACGDRAAGDGELVPYWVYPVEEGWAVESHVLALPFSRELELLGHLRRALAVYRLAFGQARQDDLIHHLTAQLGEAEAARLADELQIDLRPPGSRRTSPQRVLPG